MLNLTQHKATPDQIAAGVVDPDNVVREVLKTLLTFNSLEETKEIHERAVKIKYLAVIGRFTEVMIGGAPYLMSALEKELAKAGIKAYYAFTTREVEEIEIDGKVEKKAIFKHAGFVPAA